MTKETTQTDKYGACAKDNKNGLATIEGYIKSGNESESSFASFSFAINVGHYIKMDQEKTLSLVTWCIENLKSKQQKNAIQFALFNLCTMSESRIVKTLTKKSIEPIWATFNTHASDQERASMEGYRAACQREYKGLRAVQKARRAAELSPKP